MFPVHYDEFSMAFNYPGTVKEKWRVNLKRMDGVTRTIEIDKVRYIAKDHLSGPLHRDVKLSCRTPQFVGCTAELGQI